MEAYQINVTPIIHIHIIILFMVLYCKFFKHPVRKYDNTKSVQQPPEEREGTLRGMRMWKKREQKYIFSALFVCFL